MNYTSEQTEYMVEEYKRKPSRITVDRLAKELDKTWNETNKLIQSIAEKIGNEL